MADLTNSKVAVSDIVHAVRVILDEIGFNDSNFISTDQDNADMDTIIKNRIEDSVRAISMAAPAYMCDGITISTDYQKSSLNFDGSGQVAKMTMPKDFMRILYAKMKSWVIPASKIVYDNSPMYAMQKDKYARGTFQSPVVAICNVTTTYKEPIDSPAGPGQSDEKSPFKVELYSSFEPGDELEYLVYMPIPKIVDDQIMVSDKLKEAVYYRCAAMVAITYKDQNAQNLLELSKQLIQV